MKKKLLITLACLLILSYKYSQAQITLLGSFNPGNISTICGLGYDPDSLKVWVYGCSDSQFHSYDTSGSLLSSIAVPGGSSNDVDMEIAPVQLNLHNSTIDKGQVLFINGEVDVAEIYALDQVTGAVIDTLVPGFGNSHVVGGAYHPGRNSFFMLQDNVPSTALENLIAEIDPVTGDTLQVFQISDYFNVFFGDIEVGGNGNLFVVSSSEDSIAEFSPTGSYIRRIGLPQGVSGLSGIALACASGEAWVSANSGTVFHLGNFPCGVTGIEENQLSSLQITNVAPNPFTSEFNFSIALMKTARLTVSLWNIPGEKVSVLFEGESARGKHDFSFSSNTLPKGMYLLKAEAEGFSECKRLVKIQ